MSVSERAGFQELFDARYRARGSDRLLALDIRAVQVHQWEFDDEFKQRFPRTAEVLSLSKSYQVEYSRYEKTHHKILAFWRCRDGHVATWLLEMPPLSEALQQQASTSAALKMIHRHFGGFSYPVGIDGSNSDMPKGLERFTELFRYPTEHLPVNFADLFVELSGDPKIERRIRELCVIADDQAGNYLTIGPSSEEVFLLSRDEDLFKNAGMPSVHVGNGGLVLFTNEGFRTVLELMEFVSWHVLSRVNATGSDAGDEPK